MNKYCKRLIEVDLPIKKISEHSRREKSIRHGHISTLHIWWARRPLAACRAVILASLLPDPADTGCPEEFREKAIKILRKAKERVVDGQWSVISGEGLRRAYEGLSQIKLPDSHLPTSTYQLQLRKSLLDFIADFSTWEMSTNQVYLNIARELVSAAHTALGGEPGTRPLVVDPFAGGGSIPLEALRVGADAFAMDYNPVAVLILKVLLEYIPKYGHKLAEEVKKWGEWIKKEAEKELSEFYPKDPDGSIPIAYIWARTIKCEGPGCGAEVPLMRSLWLAKKGKRSVALRMIPNRKEKRVDFEIIKGDLKEKDVQPGTVKRGSATCPVCGYTTPVVRVREQAKEKGLPVRMVAVVTSKQGQSGKNYRLPTEQDLKAVQKAEKELEKRKGEHKGSLSLVPDEPMDQENMNLVSGRGHGFKNWGDLFTPRQALALSVFAQCINKMEENETNKDKPTKNIQLIKTCLGLILDFIVNRNCALCRWESTRLIVTGTYARQALPMVWDFGEANPLSESTGNWNGAVEWIIRVISHVASSLDISASVQRCSATNQSLPDQSINVMITDPPYYDAICYADLSDFFYVWLKRTIGDLHPELFETRLCIKDEEIVVNKYAQNKDIHFFEDTMTQAMQESRRTLKGNGVGVVVFAHKSTSGWEAMLKAMVDAGWNITASWPIDTEMQNRIRAMGTASLASSIHLVCRPRPQNAGVGDWRQVLSELQPRIHEWMPRLSKEGVVGADAIFSCLGPALEIFSRYERVETASGKKVELREYLEHVWAAVAREALNMIFAGADASGFEEDSRLTALWLWTLHSGQLSVASGQNQLSVNREQRSGDEELDTDHSPLATKKPSGFFLEYDAARKIAQGLGSHLEVLGGPGGIVEVKGDKARLISVSERWKALFGKDLSASWTRQVGKEIRPRRKKKSEQATLFEMPEEVKEEEVLPSTGKTVLDRLHQAMLLFADGRSSALRRFIVDEGIGNDDRFWRLADVLNYLYPRNSNEWRWVNGVLGKKKSFGF